MVFVASGSKSARAVELTSNSMVHEATYRYALPRKGSGGREAPDSHHLVEGTKETLFRSFLSMPEKAFFPKHLFQSFQGLVAVSTSKSEEHSFFLGPRSLTASTIASPAWAAARFVSCLLYSNGKFSPGPHFHPGLGNWCDHGVVRPCETASLEPISE